MCTCPAFQRLIDASFVRITDPNDSNLRKVKILLDALERAGKSASYFALDLMQSELERTLAEVPKNAFKHVKCAGLWGTYDDGLEWLKRPENAARPKAILSLGSSIGNFTPEEAVPFISQFAAELKPDDMILIALDGCQDPEKVYQAYNDRGNVTQKFTMVRLLFQFEIVIPHDQFVGCRVSFGDVGRPCICPDWCIRTD